MFGDRFLPEPTGEVKFAPGGVLAIGMFGAALLTLLLVAFALFLTQHKM
jgi:hypothetical protein